MMVHLHRWSVQNSPVKHLSTRQPLSCACRQGCAHTSRASHGRLNVTGWYKSQSFIQLMLLTGLSKTRVNAVSVSVSAWGEANNGDRQTGDPPLFLHSGWQLYPLLCLCCQCKRHHREEGRLCLGVIMKTAFISQIPSWRVFGTPKAVNHTLKLLSCWTQGQQGTYEIHGNTAPQSLPVAVDRSMNQ